MTKKLDELLDLMPIPCVQEDTPDIIQESRQVVPVSEAKTTMEKIVSSIPTIKGLGEEADAELEVISQKALSAFEDLMDLAMNVEAQHSSKIFEVASSMLRNSLDAKATKQANKIKILELQIKQARLEHDTRPKGDPVTPSETSGGAALVTDRKSLIAKLSAMKDTN